MKSLMLGVVLFSSLLSGCGSSSAPAGAAASAMALRLYQVPPEQTESLYAALNNVLNNGDKQHAGNVTTVAPGRLLVLAPTDLQDSIASSLNSMASASKPPVPASPQLRLQFWSIGAQPGTAQDEATLTSLKPALDEVRSQLGPAHFALNAHAVSVSSAGQNVQQQWNPLAESGVASSTIASLQYKLIENSEGLRLTIDIEEPIAASVSGQGSNVQYRNYLTRTTISVRAGQTLVLAQMPISSALKDGANSSGMNASGTTRLYVVRVDPIAAP